MQGTSQPKERKPIITASNKTGPYEYVLIVGPRHKKKYVKGVKEACEKNRVSYCIIGNGVGDVAIEDLEYLRGKVSETAFIDVWAHGTKQSIHHSTLTNGKPIPSVSVLKKLKEVLPYASTTDTQPQLITNLIITYYSCYAANMKLNGIPGEMTLILYSQEEKSSWVTINAFSIITRITLYHRMMQLPPPMKLILATLLDTEDKTILCTNANDTLTAVPIEFSSGFLELAQYTQFTEKHFADVLLLMATSITDRGRDIEGHIPEFEGGVQLKDIKTPKSKARKRKSPTTQDEDMDKLWYETYYIPSFTLLGILNNNVSGIKQLSLKNLIIAEQGISVRNHSLIRYALKKSKVEIAKILIDKGLGSADILLAYKHHLDTLPNLLSKLQNSDPNIEIEYSTIHGDKKAAPIWIAVGSRNLDMLKGILAHPDIDPNLPNNKGELPLYAAMKMGQYEVATVLLQHEKTYQGLNEVLYKFIHTNHIYLLDRLLLFIAVLFSNFINPNAIILASSSLTGNNASIKFCLEQVDRYNSQAEYCPAVEKINIRALITGKTALHTAVEKHNYVAISMLLSSQYVDPNTKNSKGQTALELAMSLNDNKAIVLLNNDPYHRVQRTADASVAIA